MTTLVLHNLSSYHPMQPVADAQYTIDSKPIVTAIQSFIMWCPAAYIVEAF